MAITKNLDKVLHFVGGILIFGFTGHMLFVIAAAVGKEAYDQVKYKGWDWRDLLVTINGGLVAYATKGAIPVIQLF
jgi:hypothetical protein